MGVQGSLHLAMLLLKVVLYNALSLVAASRITEIAAEVDADLLLVTGTRLRQKDGRRFWVETLDGNRTAIHFGYGRSPFTNKECGSDSGAWAKTADESCVRYRTST